MSPLVVDLLPAGAPVDWSWLTGPCEWPISYMGCADTSVLDGMGDDKPKIEAMATECLWRWTNRVFGLCDVTVRPCRQDCTTWQSTYFGSGGSYGSGLATPWQPVLVRGEWFNLSCQRCGDQCGCDDTPALALPGPVVSVTEVIVDGRPLAPNSYRVDNLRWLVRTDGGEWPTCQNLSAGPEAPDTWQVTYQRGLPVPEGGQVAAGLLAVEFAKALCNDTTCQLPRRVQSVTRQGVTIAVLDSFDDIDSGHTGIWMIDAWVASVMRPRRASTVRSVDVPVGGRFRRTTWPR